MWLWLGISLAVVLLDQFAKALIVGDFRLGESRAVTSFFDVVRLENTGMAWSLLANAGATLCWWIALSLSARALDLGRAHIMNLGGFRPLNALLTGVRGTLGHPISALGLSAWGGIGRLLLFVLWFGLDLRLHIHGTGTWLLACVLLLIYLLLSSFLRVTLAAGAYALLGRN